MSSECTEENKCIVPEKCVNEDDQCGYSCCKDGETCVNEECCPSLKYIKEENICCTQVDKDAIAHYDKTIEKYRCKVPEENDNCLDSETNTPIQAKCNKSGEDKLYCKVTKFSGCKPIEASCKPIPSYNEKPLTAVQGAVSLSDEKFIETTTAMDWWSAKDFCESLGKELLTRANVGDTDCNNNPTARRIHDILGIAWSPLTWLDDAGGCNANSFRALYGSVTGMGTANKTGSNNTICQPKGYTEPNPICPQGTYNIANDRCDCDQTTCACLDGNCDTNRCTRVSYLESSGTQYIDTGWKVDWSKDISITGTFAFPTLGQRLCIIGGYSAANELNIEIQSNKLRLYELGGSVNLFSATTLTNDTSYPFSFTYNASTGTTSLSTTGINISTTKVSASSSGQTERLFADNRGTGTFKALRIYGINISNGSFVRNFIPVKTSCGSPAMYDQTTSTLFYNQGSNDFTAH